MGKRSKKSREPLSDEDNDDVVSLGSSSSKSSAHTEHTLISQAMTTFGAHDDDNNLEEKLAEHLENLTEKRPTVREASLVALLRYLSGYRFDWAINNQATLSLYLRRCVSKGKPQESILAMQVLGQLLVTVGEEGAELLEEWRDTFTTLLKTGKHAVKQEQAFLVYSVMCFILDTEGTVSAECIDLCMRKWTQEPAPAPQEVVASLNAWGLLLTTVPLRMIVDAYYDNAVQAFVEMLKGNHIDVRAAAGENLALLVDLFREEDKESAMHVYDAAPELPDLIADMLNECAKKRSKKDRLKQRTAFRFINSTLNDDEVPQEKLTIRGASVTFSTWRQLCRLDAFRALLQSGFQNHVQDNELLHTVFQIKPQPRQDKHDEGAKADKKIAMSHNSAASKERDNQRNKSRRLKQSRHLMNEE